VVVFAIVSDTGIRKLGLRCGNEFCLGNFHPDIPQNYDITVDFDLKR
jgi:hypothetical protein